MKAHQRILHERGYQPPAPAETEYVYAAFHISAGYPEMAFSVECANGDRHAIFYHNIDNLKSHEGAHGEYIAFTHRGKAITIRGCGLEAAYDAILQHRLQRVTEVADSDEMKAGEPVVDRILVTEPTAIPQ